MMVTEQQRKLQRALRHAGNLYELEDILGHIERGDFQSFPHKDSWVITCITDYPKKRVMRVLYALGDLHEVTRKIYPEMLQWALENEVDIIEAEGRDGWEPEALFAGWKKAAVVYRKEL